MDRMSLHIFNSVNMITKTSLAIALGPANYVRLRIIDFI